MLRIAMLLTWPNPRRLRRGASSVPPASGDQNAPSTDVRAVTGLPSTDSLAPSGDTVRTGGGDRNDTVLAPAAAADATSPTMWGGSFPASASACKAAAAGLL